MRKLVVSLFIVAASAVLFAGATAEKPEAAAGGAAMQTRQAKGLSVADFLDPKIPKSWFEAPRLASQVGIKSFKESPMLAERVRAGKLPPVAERLPKDPPVVQPYAQVGKYGGTLNIWATQNDYRGDTVTFKWPEKGFGPGIPTPDGQKMVPFLVQGWEYSSDATQLTITFREGLKWSDGVPVTADDMMFWWEHVARNKLLTARDPEKFTPVGLKNVEKLGAYKVRMTFVAPNPRQHDIAFYLRFVDGMATGLDPAHFMKQIHPDFVGEEKAKAIAKENGYDDWAKFYLNISNESPDHPEYKYQAPVVRPYVVVERGPQGMLWERNPYWPFVDTEGNQLPYIDKVRVSLAANQQIATAKMVTGEADYSARFTETKDFPLYKANEAKGNYRTFAYSRVFGSDVSVQLNLSHKDPEMRAIFQDVRFRRALSLSINRAEINNKVYYGQAIVMQATIPPTSKYFKQEYADSYVQFDPAGAKKLLDEIGMKDIDGDGFREMPNGKKFRPTLVHAPLGIDAAPVVELLIPMFQAVGLQIEGKGIARALHDTMWPANEGDIHALLMDQLTDTAFGVADKDFSPAGVGVGKDTPWPAYRTWVETRGEKGMEPPPILKKTIELRTQLATHPDPKVRDDAARQLLEIQAENLWYIGTVAMAPHPVMVANRLKNVPEKGIWDWRSTYMHAYWPAQFYLEQ